MYACVLCVLVANPASLPATPTTRYSAQILYPIPLLLLFQANQLTHPLSLHSLRPLPTHHVYRQSPCRVIELRLHKPLLPRPCCSFLHLFSLLSHHTAHPLS